MKQNRIRSVYGVLNDVEKIIFMTRGLTEKTHKTHSFHSKQYLMIIINQINIISTFLKEKEKHQNIHNNNIIGSLQKQ